MVKEDPDFEPYFRVDDGAYRGAYAPNSQYLTDCEALRTASEKAWH